MLLPSGRIVADVFSHCGRWYNHIIIVEIETTCVWIMFIVADVVATVGLADVIAIIWADVML